MEGETPLSLASVEEVWTNLFNQLCERLGPCFARSETREGVKAYLRGLLSPVERKNGWQLAEQAGLSTPYAMQYLLNRALWESDEVRNILQAYVREMLGPGGILVIDETGFLKKGKKSVGVQRQYSGTAGRIENCQIGVFLTYALHGDHTLVDRELYLPKSWAEDRQRCQAAHVPEEVSFATKPELAARMLCRTTFWGTVGFLGDRGYRLRKPSSAARRVGSAISGLCSSGFVEGGRSKCRTNANVLIACPMHWDQTNGNGSLWEMERRDHETLTGQTLS